MEQHRTKNTGNDMFLLFISALYIHYYIVPLWRENIRNPYYIIITNNLIINQCFVNPALITFVSSIAAVQGSYDTVYAASKSGQIGCAKSIAKHHAPRLRANVICPGMIKDSGMYNSMSIDDQMRHIDQTPTKQLTTVEHLAEIILKLDNQCFSNLNGAVINLNGGRFV